MLLGYYKNNFTVDPASGHKILGLRGFFQSEGF
jgi:hypothetical protein